LYDGKRFPRKYRDPFPRVPGRNDAGEGRLPDRQPVINRRIYAAMDRRQRRRQGQRRLRGVMLEYLTIIVSRVAPFGDRRA
jgi:hypothetical protein